MLAGVALAAVGDPQRVSLDNLGGDGPSTAQGAAVSATGRWVAFTSVDPLTASATGGVRQLYVRDRVSGTTSLASARAGVAADAPVDDATDFRSYALSGDGRFAVFATQAANLTSGDNDGADRDVFRKDLLTGAVVLVSHAVGGGPANGPVVGDPDISFDGSVVTYESGSATNLWPGDTDVGNDIVAYDVDTRSATLVSAASDGSPLTGVIRRPSISADANRVAFEDDGQIIVRDRRAGVTVPGPIGGAADLSGDGRAVAFEGVAGDVRLSEPVGGASTLIAAAGSGPTISADGSLVAFATTAALVGADTNGLSDIYARGVGATPVRISQRADATGVDRASDRAAISGDGGALAFSFDDGGPGQTLNPQDTDAAVDVLMAEPGATDVSGPAFSDLRPLDGEALTDASVPVTGHVADASGVVRVTVDGFPALIDPAKNFSVQVPVVVGASLLTVRATDGAGNVTERQIAVTRPEPQPSASVPASRARSLKVLRSGRLTRVRFILDPGATRVTIRLWRRVLRPGAATTWTPVGPLRVVATNPGTRSVGISATPLRPGVYQVRVIAVSPGGIGLSVSRFTVPRRT